MLARIMLLAAYAIGYNVLLGYTGLMSLGHALFFAAGMYGTGLSVYYWGFPPAPALAVGIAASVLLAAAVGWIALRTAGVSFLIVTMMFAQAFYLATLYFNTITMGEQGFVLSAQLAPLRLGGRDFAFSDPVVKYNAAFVVFALCLVLTVWLTRSPIGRILVAVRENEGRTRLLGYNTFNYKLLALLISAGISGAAGATYTLVFAYVGSSFASILYSIYPLLWTLLGGAGTTLGPLVGTAAMTYVVDIASELTSSYLLVVGAALVALVVWFPAGAMGHLRSRVWPWLP
ncbi:MAG: branched-chain amino acid ABC transporter permease [Candidatus Rokubacteria bacterium]|nr:branched-chain amino acid ABC transporter permease [Candidatus Rokubacteria bacterium]